MIRLLRNKLRRANRRRHRPCTRCGAIPIVCNLCARLWCIECKPKRCPWPHTITTMLPQSLPSQSMQPKNTAVGTQLTGKKSHHKQTLTQKEIDVPRALEDWVQIVQAEGGIVDQPVKEGPGKWKVKVTLTPRSILANPGASAYWNGLKITSIDARMQNTPPTIEAILKEEK
jgi:hypothetical protein